VQMDDHGEETESAASSFTMPSRATASRQLRGLILSSGMRHLVG